MSYWLGIASLVIAVIWTGLNALHIWTPTTITAGQTVYYMGFYKACLLFFVGAIASASSAWINSQKP